METVLYWLTSVCKPGRRDVLSAAAAGVSDQAAGSFLEDAAATGGDGHQVGKRAAGLVGQR